MRPTRQWIVISVLGLLAGCSTRPPDADPSARPGTAVLGCAQLAQDLHDPGLRIATAQEVAAGTLKVAGIASPMPEHCLIQGELNRRTSAVDGKSYAIGFEMRLPTHWNGRFFYQANGGLDGFVTPAYGNILGGGPSSNGLLKGFAVLSTNGGHAFERDVPVVGGATFGRDPQARQDYGYNAVVLAAPMAQALIRRYYGRPADRSYLVGSSNGGRLGMVAAARDLGGFDGIAVTTPGYRLPLAAMTQVWDAQQFARVARQTRPDGIPELESSFTTAELALLAHAIERRCDALDGLADGLVQDVKGCLAQFQLRRDVPLCPAGTDPDARTEAACLSPAQIDALEAVFKGPGPYPGLPFDPGLRGQNWREWKFSNSLGPRDAIALAFVFTTPPDGVAADARSVARYALDFDPQTDATKLEAHDAVYPQSAMDFMTPPDAMGLESFVKRGGKLLVAHGGADPVFSALDSIRWYEGFTARHGEHARDSARLYLVPGMNHSLGGPATDQFDLVEALVAWVERGQAPEAIEARARGRGSLLPNPEVPADWSPQRSRPLCPWPSVARYVAGDPEQATSFRCR
ncbi:MAG: tannase/feruloyl esterase family alpha/beta hydrolase [Curvibacter sp.]|nr:tannase/feruloyl esterase family alpha/beta hydrolase [Curvibacter sp.]